MRSKCCSGCRRWLPLLTSFHQDHNRPDGHESRCRACRKARNEELKAGATKFKPWQKQAS